MTNDMVFCKDCGCAFERSELRAVPTGVGHRGVELEEMVCPACGGDDYEDAVQCEYCHEWEPESSFYESDVDGMCGRCYAEAWANLRKMVEAGGKEADLALLQYFMEVY